MSSVDNLMIPLAVAKAHLQMDHDDDDEDIVRKTRQACDIVLDYLKMPVAPYAWVAGMADDPQRSTAPPLIEAAVLLVLGNLYMNREGGTGSEFRPPEPLTDAVKNLLWRSRHPALA